MHEARAERCGKQRGADNLSTYDGQVAVLSHRRGHEESLGLQLARGARLYTTHVGVIDKDAMQESVLGCETHSRSMCTGGEEHRKQTRLCIHVRRVTETAETEPKRVRNLCTSMCTDTACMVYSLVPAVL
jgi:hypothetical protein